MIMRSCLLNRLRERLSKLNRELIYAAGLLHDIGRWQEYEEGIRHEIASADLASRILCECGYNEQEIEEIRRAILNHRNSSIKDENSLTQKNDNISLYKD